MRRLSYQRYLPGFALDCPACGEPTDATQGRRFYCKSCDISWSVTSPREWGGSDDLRPQQAREQLRGGHPWHDRGRPIVTERHQPRK
jgi:hypothetical protein